MNPLLGQSDSTWSSRLGESGWPDPNNSDSTDGKDWQPGGAAFTDLVPEFEPGKPWKVIHFQYRQSVIYIYHYEHSLFEKLTRKIKCVCVWEEK